MSTRRIEVDLPIVLPNGEDFNLVVEREVTYDSDYGSDADGHRGQPVYFLGPCVIKNMAEVMLAIEVAAGTAEDEFIDAMEEASEPDPDEDDDE